MYTRVMCIFQCLINDSLHMRLTHSGEVHPVGNVLECERLKCQGKSARLCLHEGVGNIYIYI